MKDKPCTRHRAHPEFIYTDCIGCDIEGYNNDLNILKGDLSEIKKENDELRGGIRLAISSLNDHMHPNRNGPKCWGCQSLYGYAHQSYCIAMHVVELLENRLKGGEV